MKYGQIKFGLKQREMKARGKFVRFAGGECKVKGKYYEIKVVRYGFSGALLKDAFSQRTT